MKTLATITILVIAAMLMSCASGSRTDPRTGVVTKYCMLGTDAQSVVIDGPMPTVIGYQPVLDKKGKVIGQQPLFGPSPTQGNALYASYGQVQSKGLSKVCGVVTNSVASMVLGSVLRAYDDNKTSVDKDAIAAQSAKDSQAAALETTKANNAHAENMVGLEESVAASAAAPTVPTP